MKNSLIILLILIAINFIACKQKTEKKINSDDYKESLEKINKYLISQDSEKIANYVTRKQWNMQVTKTGLWYEIYENGTGIKAELDKIATLKFNVELLDGTKCYNSDSVGAKRFKIGKGGVESGLEQALLLMKVGDKAHVILPPFLNFGLLGDEVKIPPRSIIVYDVELLDISDY